MNNSKKKWNAKSRGGAFGYHFFIKLISIFGVNIAYVLLAFVTIYFIPFAPKATRSIWYYYRNIHKYSILRSLYSLYIHYFVFGQTLIDKLALLTKRKDSFRFEFEESESSMFQSNAEGLVIIGAHIGSWEMGSGFFNEYGKKINIVMYDAEHDSIKSVIHKYQETVPYSIIPINKGGLEAILKIKVALNNGESVCFQGDRYIDEKHKILLPFMGKMAYFPEGPFLLASKLGKPIVFYFSIRKGKCYKFYFSNAQSNEKLGSKTYMYDIAKQYVSELENQIKKHPHQWFNFYQFWENKKHIQ